MTLNSPGIDVREYDLTTIVPSVASTEGAIAGVFAWGPVGEPILVTSEVDLVNRFGKPKTGFNTETFFTAADFLSYADALYVSRADGGASATVTKKDSANNDVVAFEAVYPGEMGNSIAIHVMDKEGYYANTNVFGAALFSYDSATRVTTTEKATQIGLEPGENEYHIVVVDTLGVFGGAAGTVLESFTNVSTEVGAKLEDGTSKYIYDVINTRSNFIRLAEPTATFDPASFFINYLILQLEGGLNSADENTIPLNSLCDAYSVFESKEAIDISLIMQGTARHGGTGSYTQLANWIIDNIVHVRKDCMLFVSPNKDAVVGPNTNKLTDVIVFKNGRAPGMGGTGNPGTNSSPVTVKTELRPSSYVVMDSGYKYRYDRYNDKYVWTPLNGDIAGLCARTDDERDPWWSPAGYNRGAIKNVVKLAWSPKQAERDTLYQNNINPVLTQVGYGTLLFGDKTAMNRPSAFDRINVRRLFIVLEKAVAKAARNFLFEFNDEFTRAQFTNIIEPYLRDIQGRRGIYDYRVVCDETNNTATIIDANKFVGDIYVKPARVINFIQLNFIAVRTGVEFTEIVGKY